MRVLGIDPGLERIGWGLVERSGSQLRALDYGLIETPRIALPDRLLLARTELRSLVERCQPDEAATERLLFSVNRKTAMDVAKSLGVILLAVAEAGLPWAEYAPQQIKQGVTGSGSAEKAQVSFMVVRLLGLAAPPRPDDVADALAIAVTHALASRGR